MFLKSLYFYGFLVDDSVGFYKFFCFLCKYLVIKRLKKIVNKIDKYVCGLEIERKYKLGNRF